MSDHEESGGRDHTDDELEAVGAAAGEEAEAAAADVPAAAAEEAEAAGAPAVDETPVAEPEPEPMPAGDAPPASPGLAVPASPVTPTSPGMSRKGMDKQRDDAKSRINQTPKGKAVNLTDGSVLDCYCKVRDDDDMTNWMVLSYDGPTKLVATCGTGGFAEMKGEVKDQPMYLYLRFVFGDTDRAKFILYSFVPEQLGGMQKSRVAQHKGAVSDFIKYFHVEMAVTEARDIKEDALVAKLKASGGADYGVGSGGGSRGAQNFGGIKNQSKSFLKEVEKQGNVKAVFHEGPLSTTPCDLSGRPMVASASEAKKNTDMTGKLDVNKIALNKK